MREKLIDTIGPVRVESGKREQLDSALRFYRLDRADFLRRCVDAMIDHAERRELPDWPLEFVVRNR